MCMYVFQIAKKLEEPASKLELKVVRTTDDLKVYIQGNKTASRKVILPLISTVIGADDTQPADRRGRESCP